jgi:hypothetical protein
MSIKSKLETDRATQVPFGPTADIPQTDVERAIKQVQTNLDAVEAAASAALAAHLLASGTWSGVTEVVFTGLSSTYFKYTLVCDDIALVDDDIAMLMELSSDGGSSYLTTGYQGGFIGRESQFDGSWSNFAWSWTINPADTNIVLNGEIGAAGNGTVSLTLDLINPTAPNSTVVALSASFTGGTLGSTVTESYISGHGAWRYSAATAIDAFRIFVTSGNFAGRYRLYGWKA